MEEPEDYEKNFENRIIIDEDGKEKDIKEEYATEKENILSILVEIFKNKDSKEKKNSISKKNYELILDFINKVDDDTLFQFFDCLNDLDLPILQVLIKGYIKIDFEEKENELVLKQLEKLFKIYFSKALFKCVYKQLSKLFRKNYLLKNLDTVKEFEKIFNVWKLLYNIENNQVPIQINYYNFDEDFEIDIKNEAFYSGSNSLIIEINFTFPEIFKKMISDENFYFLQLDDGDDLSIIFSLLDNFNKDDIKQIKLKDKNTMKLLTEEDSLKFLINGKEIKPSKEGKKTFKFEGIKKIKFLNYFFYINITNINVEIINGDKKNSQTLKAIIEKKNFSDKYTSKYKLEYKNVKKDKINKKKENIDFDDDDSVHCSNIKFGKSEWLKGKARLDNIIYYGGIESFIPLFKIIKYILDNLGNNQNISKQKNEDYINKSIIWIKDIIKIILRLISLSEQNYTNFKKCIIPLIGAFAEISHSLNNLKKSNLFSQEQENALFKDETIYSLLIAIIYARINRNIIEMYMKIFQIKPNWDINFSMDYLLYDIKNIEDSNFYWYFSILFIYASFILMYNDSPVNSPQSIIEHINKIRPKDRYAPLSVYFLSVEPFFKFIEECYKDPEIKNYEKKCFFSNCKVNKNLFYLLMSLVKTLLNVEYLSDINKDINKKNSIAINYTENNKHNNIFNKLQSLLIINKVTIYKRETQYEEILKSFHNYGEDKNKLIVYFDLKNKLEIYIDLGTNELVDYHGLYHKVMKELFSFNRLWSKEKLFCDEFNKKSKDVKYKVINYYTRNFQRSVVYPVLDYKYRYPEFSQYKMPNDFYIENKKEKKEKNEINEINEKNEIKDDYNFNLDCKELDDLVKDYHMKIYKGIGKKYSFLKVFNVCLVKQLYHIKGTLFVFVIDDKPKIIFFSNPYNFIDGKENKKKCNKEEKDKDKIEEGDKTDYEKDEELCYGQIFKCPKKEYNRKIEINTNDIRNDIRMILKKIYCNSKSAVEIFTETKSYFFNFFSEEELTIFMSLIEYLPQKSKNDESLFHYMPIIIDSKEKIGYIKMNKNFDKNKDNDFINFISIKNDINQMCNFDLIIFLNLIANRSYLDLNHYPVFPAIFFYDQDKQKIVERYLDKHIGFQDQTAQGKVRKEKIKNLYNDNKGEVDDLSYFRTNYSNATYTASNLIRLFPYTFCSIEIQKVGFDKPDRCFISLELLLSMMINTQGNFMELIPEFFYLPEMLMNINNIKFPQPTEGIFDDIDISNNLIKKELESYEKVLDINNKKEDRKRILKMFIFILKMKTKLEKLGDKITPWLNIIFGKKQRYLDKKKEKQLFTSASYINYINEDENISGENAIDDEKMTQVEIGQVPSQIIFHESDLNTMNDRNFKYKNKLKDKYKNQNIINDPEALDKKEREIKSFIDKNYWDNYENISFKIYTDYSYGKIKIYKNNIFIDEISDHNNKILNLYYNRRLNMFATWSLDGLICTYVFPNKLISIIKHPKKLHFDKVVLSANPFPTIIAYEKNNNCFYSYSLNGMLINRFSLENIQEKINEKVNVSIKFYFDVYGGCQKDSIEVIFDYTKRKLLKKNISKVFELPFFNEPQSKIKNLFKKII